MLHILIQVGHLFILEREEINPDAPYFLSFN